MDGAEAKKKKPRRGEEKYGQLPLKYKKKYIIKVDKYI
jgi:hypothetical protein